MRDLLRGLPSLAGPLPEFDPSAAPGDPLPLFESWLREAVAAGVREPHAMTLSTVDASGRPSARVLILKDAGPDGFRFASAAGGRKGAELAATPFAALTFYWSSLGRQVRLRGAVTAAPRADSERDFLARAPRARAVALAGRQSTPLRDRAELAAAVAAADTGTVPPDWTLYTVEPDEFEFWQADSGRAHVRLSYRRHAAGWDRELLWP
ncbi:pyridoxine/pyridoxamine 5'-phosphate oxidase [Amycolatopsis suaedae]|uniref:Pyridoxamine 5'-phosphate oxidase n=1 Tax=Amycolatopsis suaedae TaxID=2510978 RepID=A0A4Q7IZL4_9PSEU|nr:pyridoxal 5'-phosphate synthase [Amycolatopsis suaedae]RZQ59927.1 pyridoxamine 5'-phosphate oxidase [Amycolatopsis suaedae]